MNLGINYSKSNRSPGHCSVRMRSPGKKSTSIGETKHVQSMLHPHTSIDIKDWRLHGIRCQAKFLTCEISDFTPCTNAQSNIPHIKYAEKSDD